MGLLAVAAIIVPVFALVALGWAAARWAILRPGTGEGLSDFVFVVAVPVLVFKTLATADLPSSPPWGLWGAYFAGITITWAVSAAVMRALGEPRATVGVIAGLGGSFANTVMVGIPLTLTAFGKEGAVALFLIISVHLPTMMIVGSLAMERAQRRDGAASGPIRLGALLRRVLVNLARNPIALAIVAAGLYRSAGLPLPEAVRATLDLIGQAAIPTALVATGMAVHRYGRAQSLVPALALSGIKLVLMPAIVWLAAHALGLPPLWIAVATLTAACPAGINVHLIASHFRVSEGLATSVISLSTVLSLVTLWAWLMLLGR